MFVNVDYFIVKDIYKHVINVSSVNSFSLSVSQSQSSSSSCLTGTEHFVDGAGQGPIITIVYLFVSDFSILFSTSF